MPTVIIHSSRHGAALKGARLLQDRLAAARPDDDVVLADVDVRIPPALAGFDTVVLCADPSADAAPSPLHTYAANHERELAVARLGVLFADETGPAATAPSRLSGVLPAALLAAARAAAVVGAPFGHDQPTVWTTLAVDGVPFRAAEPSSRAIDSFAAALTAPEPDITA